MTNVNQNGKANMVKSYELRIKETNEVLAICISEVTIRKEGISYVENGGTWDEIYVQENFIPISEWNNAMLGK
jgi:hypothetical protein